MVRQCLSLSRECTLAFACHTQRLPSNRMVDSPCPQIDERGWSGQTSTPLLLRTYHPGGTMKPLGRTRSRAHTMVTEDDVRNYRYQRQVFLDGRNASGKFAIQVSVCRENPRVVVHWNSQTGQRFCLSTASSWSIRCRPASPRGSTPKSPRW
jgi:hypothetical protein